MNKGYGESGRFYRDIKLIKFCKVCGIEYRPARGSFVAMAGINFCHKHRSFYYKEFYAKYLVPWFKRQTPEIQKKYKDMKYNVWKKWVERNLEKRRAIALKSYHKRKKLKSK